MGKLNSHAKVGRFFSYDEQSKAYRVYYPEHWVVSIKSDVRFNPNKVLVPDDNVGGGGEWHLPDLPTLDPTVESGTPNITDQPKIHEDSPKNPPDQPIAQDPAPEAHVPDGLIPAQPNTSQGFRQQPPPGHYKNINNGHTDSESVTLTKESPLEDKEFLCTFSTSILDRIEGAFPTIKDTPTWKDAISGPDHEKWLVAQDEGMKMINNLHNCRPTPWSQCHSIPLCLQSQM